MAITLDRAGLWTDSRYFLQAAEQLAGSGIELMKQGLPDTPEIVPWLATVLQAGDKVGVNPQMFPLNAYAGMKAELAISHVELVSVDLLAEVWTDRPALPRKPLFLYDENMRGHPSAKSWKASAGSCWLAMRKCSCSRRWTI